jgi:outer membrane protein assembly factor BamB
MVWRIECGKHVQTTGLWVDEHVWTGNMLGECFKLDRDTGALIESRLLPGECVAVVSDDAWKYAGCSDGCIYDLTGSVARVAYQLGGARHDWLEVYQGALCVSDPRGDGDRHRRRWLDPLAQVRREGARGLGASHRGGRPLSRKHGGAS